MENLKLPKTSFHRDSLHRMAMLGSCHLGWQKVGGMLILTVMLTLQKGCWMFLALLVRCWSLSVEVIFHSLMPFSEMIGTLYKVEALWVSGDNSMKTGSRKR